MPNPGEEPDGSVFNALGQVEHLSILTIDAYGVAVRNGFRGTVTEWLESLVGDPGVHFGSDLPPDTANVWIDPNGEPTSTEDWDFTLYGGTTETKRVVVVGAEEENGHSGILRLKDENGVWRMDYEDIEKKIRQYRIHTTIFCSPHNPTGRVWEREELERAFEIFERNNVYVVSDEIWSDLILEGHKHIPLQSVSEDARNRTVAFYAPSKTFNLAGLVGSYHIIYNDYLRARIKRQSALSVYNSMNVLSMHALIGAYKDEGMEWVDELRTVLTGNVDFAYEFIKSNFKGVEVSNPEGTYMLLLDCGQWLKEHDKTLDELLLAGVEVGVLWQDGRQFNREDSIRMNLALPLSRVQEAFERLKQYAFV
jgi:cystathionine beta-lyase